MGFCRPDAFSCHPSNSSKALKKNQSTDSSWEYHSLALSFVHPPQKQMLLPSCQLCGTKIEFSSSLMYNLRWYGHVLRKEDTDWVKKCMEYVVKGSRPRGRPKSTWKVQKDCQARNLNKEDAMDRGRWKKLMKIG